MLHIVPYSRQSVSREETWAADLKAIGLIEPDRLKFIPKKYHAQHEFCFHLHDLMAGLLVQMEIQKAGHIRFEIHSEEDRQLLASDIHILDFLDKSGRSDIERRAVVNHVCMATLGTSCRSSFSPINSGRSRLSSAAGAASSRSSA